MPYAKCPICQQIAHYRIFERAIEEWSKRPTDNGIPLLDCFACWKTLKLHDPVEVWRVPINCQQTIKQGEMGTVVVIHTDNTYEIECVNDDGSIKWQEPLPRDCLWYVTREQGK